MAIPVIELDVNDPVIRGEIYGETARSSIKRLFEIYRDLYRESTGLTWDEIMSMLGPYFQSASKSAPHLMAEIQGIANGSGLTPAGVFALNARSEILFDLKIHSAECSSLAALPGATSDGSTLLGQNWDWNKDTESCQVILKIHRQGQIPPLVTFTEAGQVAKIGMNGAGLGLVVNTLSASKASADTPWIFTARRILESTDTESAVGLLMKHHKGHSMNFMIAHECGEAVDIETSCVENHILRPNRGFMVHTNHYLKPCREFFDNRIMDNNPSTQLRLHRIESLLEKKEGSIDAAYIKSVLMDHSDDPFSVCIHESDKIVSGMQAIKTCLSIVMDLSGKTIWYTCGSPCLNPLETLDLKAFFNG